MLEIKNIKSWSIKIYIVYVVKIHTYIFLKIYSIFNFTTKINNRH